MSGTGKPCVMAPGWRIEGEDHVLGWDVPVLRRCVLRVGPIGIEAGIFRRRTWTWPDVAAVTWDLNGGGRASLAVCIPGDPWVKELPVLAWDWKGSWDEWRALLEPIRPIVERMGARLENRDEAATHWWHLDPQARRP